jgi:GDP-4-dehydro-6-deoxy-D-mannose reductase
MKQGRRGEAYNICSGKTIVLREILNLLIKEAAVKNPISIEVAPTKLREIDMPFQTGSYEKIRQETGWLPEVSIKQTLCDLCRF